jgi:hypothetical protein
LVTQKTTYLGFFQWALPTECMLKKFLVRKIFDTYGGLPNGLKPQTLGLHFLKRASVLGCRQTDDVDGHRHV